jgi:ABC-type multidrug transport system ATPase subunit
MILNSGGQKARVTLARAVYSDANILLLDDILSALDVHTARWVAEKCIAGPLLKGRTVLLVTHNILLAGPLASFVVSLGLDGRVASQGTMQEALKSSLSLRKEAEREAEAEKHTELQDNKEEKEDGGTGERNEASGKLIVEEEMELGRVGWKACKRIHHIAYMLASSQCRIHNPCGL